MKKNTSCGCGSSNHQHQNCPPMLACDTAKTHGDFSKADVHRPNAVEEERVIAVVELSVNTEADICLPTPANDIKTIRKNVYLTQCKAFPVPRDHKKGGYPQKQDIHLFIQGYVHKNIQYSEGCSGPVQDYSVNIPFKGFHRIKDVNPVDFGYSQKSNQLNEIREIDKHGMGSDRCSFGSSTFEEFNEPIKCKLLAAEVLDMDFPHDFNNWGQFQQLTEKMSIDLVVRLTQTQVDYGKESC